MGKIFSVHHNIAGAIGKRVKVTSHIRAEEGAPVREASITLRRARRRRKIANGGASGVNKRVRFFANGIEPVLLSSALLFFSCRPPSSLSSPFEFFIVMNKKEH